MATLNAPHDPLASIERHLIRIEQLIECQNIAIAQLSDELNDLNRRNEWAHVQFSEMMRILVRDMRELRTTLICSVVNDGPISAQAIQTILRQTPSDLREIEVCAPAPLPSKHRGN